jgi:hypothetical protein
MTAKMRRLTLVVLVVVGSFAAACGGGGSGSDPGPGPGPGPTPPPPKFSNASLSGPYAFSMTGTELCAGSGSFFGRVGTFVADAHGNITGGLEDVNICTGVETLQFTGGTYSIGPDGRGTLGLTNSSGTTTYSIAFSSTTQGVIAQTDVDVTASGSFQRQNPAAFNDAAIAGGYVFDFKGVEVAGTVVSPASIVGRFDADGAGAVGNGLFDSNVAGTLSGQQTFPAGAFYQFDANTDGSIFGRGTASIAGQDFVFYAVDATRVKFIGTAFPSALAGDAFAQQNVAFDVASLSGGFAFSIAGFSSSGSIGAAGRLTADGGGNLTDVVADENDNGVITLLPNGTVTGTYTVDSNKLGGGTLTWTDTTAGTFSFIFYLISPTQGVFQETDSKIVGDGLFLAQTTSPISAAALAGDYVFGWSGVSTGQEDFVGQLALTPSGNFSGMMDFNEFATGKQFFDVPVSGSLVLTGDGTQANTFSLSAQITPARMFNFTVYVVDQSTLLLVGVDTNQVVVGTMTRQP